jgi:hypothetical protein
MKFWLRFYLPFSNLWTDRYWLHQDKNCPIVGLMSMQLQWASFAWQICGRSETLVVKLFSVRILQIDSHMWLTICSVAYLNKILHCSMGFRCFWMLIAHHQALTSIRGMQKCVLNWICSFRVVPYVSLSSWFTSWSVSVLVNVVPSVSVFNW